MQQKITKVIAWSAGLVATLMLVATLNAFASVPGTHLRTVHACVWDPVGRNGETAQVMWKARMFAHRHGVDLQYTVYESERLVMENFRVGKCDIANMLGLRARQFNNFAGSTDVVGGLSSYAQLGSVIKTLAAPKAAPWLRKGEYEVIGIAPAGAIFGFTRDRKALYPKDFHGKKMAIPEGIPEAEYLCKRFGITPVWSEIIDSFLKFNNGIVDLVGGPALVYEPFEMHKGVLPHGGIYNEPFMFITMQIVARWSRLPEGFGQHAREETLKYFQGIVDYLRAPEERIPAEVWIDVPLAVVDAWTEEFRESRMILGDDQIYEPKMLMLLRRVRCAHEPERAECAASRKE